MRWVDASPVCVHIWSSAASLKNVLPVILPALAPGVGRVRVSTASNEGGTKRTAPLSWNDECTTRGTTTTSASLRYDDEDPPALPPGFLLIRSCLLGLRLATRAKTATRSLPASSPRSALATTTPLGLGPACFVLLRSSVLRLAQRTISLGTRTNTRSVLLGLGLGRQLFALGVSTHSKEPGIPCAQRPDAVLSSGYSALPRHWPEAHSLPVNLHRIHWTLQPPIFHHRIRYRPRCCLLRPLRARPRVLRASQLRSTARDSASWSWWLLSLTAPGRRRAPGVGARRGIADEVAAS
ncbi:hypothetical protein C8R44DRAFT_231713 [Mycena epipterygia]|nr:hypothetical protein C8R44DRAFT_231713 [Mycena epipterygia]